MSEASTPAPLLGAAARIELRYQCITDRHPPLPAEPGTGTSTCRCGALQRTAATPADPTTTGDANA